MTRSTRNAAAFTLVELLVVIGIIAVLISILLPSLNSAREQGKTTACNANLRQIHNGFAMYGVANKDWIPAPFASNDYKIPGSGFSPAGSGPADGYATGFAWPFFIARYMGYKDLFPGKYDTLAVQQLDTSRATSIFQCPSFAREPLAGEIVIDPLVVFSTSLSRFQLIGGYGMNPWLPPKTPGNYIVPSYSGIQAFDGTSISFAEIFKFKFGGAAKLSKVKKSTAVVLVADSSGHAGQLGDTGDALTPAAANPLIHYSTDYLRHNRRNGLNSLFVGGHGSYMPKKEALPLYITNRIDPNTGAWRGGNQFCFQEE